MNHPCLTIVVSVAAATAFAMLLLLGHDEPLLLLLSTKRSQLSHHNNALSTTSVRSLKSTNTFNAPKDSAYTYYTKPFQYFSKVMFLNPELGNKYLPFESFPLPSATMIDVKTMSFGDSPQTQEDQPGISAAREIWELGGPPSLPRDGAVYWNELKEVTEVQIQRRNNGPPPFKLPKLWENFSIQDVAEAVNGEYPGYWHTLLLQEFWKQGLKYDTDIFAFNSLRDFGLDVRLTALNTWAIDLVCPTSFLLKWTVGRLRPEEAAFQIAQGLFDDVVPEDLKQLIDSMDLQTPEEFTAYTDKGSPTHPSWPAMHSSASAASLWLAVVADLTEEQYCELLRLDNAIANARTVAGVHYPTDNSAGLNLGQRLVAWALPQHLNRMYGIDEEVVRDKIRTLRFDWNTYDNDSCSVAYN